MRNKVKSINLACLAVAVAFTALNVNAGVIFDTLPRDDQGTFVADCGQTWKTGSLGSENKLDTIEVATRSAGASGGTVYLAVYTNNAANGSSASWGKGSLVAVSSNNQNMSVDGVVNTFNFNYEALSDNARYLYTFVDSSTNGVGVGAGVTLGTGGAEQSAYTAGGIAFSGAHTIASRITTADSSDIPIILLFKSSKTSVFPGETVSLTWSTTNTASVVMEPGVGAVAASGSTNVVVTGNITYSLIASDASSSVTNTVGITLNPAAALYAQYRADLDVTTNGLGVISSWATQTGTAHDLDRTFGTTSLAAVPRSGGGTADVVSFDGGGSLWASSGDFGTLSGDRTIAVRARLHGTSNGFLFDGSTSGGKTRAQVRNGMWQAGVQSAGAAFGSTDTDTTAITPYVWQTHIFEYEDEGGNTFVKHWIDGVEVGFHTNAVDTALSGLIAGANGSAGANLRADVAELLVYQYLMTPSERTSLLAELNGRWGDLNLPLAYQSSTATQTSSTVPELGTHGVTALEITSSGNLPTNSVTSLTYNLNGTTDSSDIEAVQLYETGTFSTFDIGNATLLASQPGPSGTFSFSHPIATTKQYLWVAVKLSGTSTNGDTIDAEITQFTLTGNDAGTYVPAITAPPESLTVDDAAFYSRIVRKGGDDGSGNFRIPGLVTTTNGTLIAAFDVRWDGNDISSPDLPGDIDTAVMRSTDGGFTWEPMQIIMDYDEMVPGSQGNGVGDPCIFVDDTNGRIWCASLWSFGNNGWNGSGPGLGTNDTGQLVLSYSDDDGITWTDPVSITEDVKDPSWNLYFQGPGKGICTRDGVLVFPAQYRDAFGTARSNFIWSDDHGATWNNAPAAISSGTPVTTESQIVELDNGDLLLSMRNHDPVDQRLWCIYSWNHATETIADGSWGTPWYDVDDPTVMGSVERYRSTLDGHPWSGLLFSNPNNPTSRVDMTVHLSLDEGASWPYKRKIDDLRAAYSCMTILPDGDIGILYETGEASSISRLAFARFPIEWLVGTTDTDGDGVSDFDEDVLGMNKADPNDAALDPDGDGMNSGDEAKSQTLPNDGSSVLSQSIGVQGASLLLDWASVPYVTYRLESSTNLTAGAGWLPVPGAEAVRADSTGVSIEIPADGKEIGFFRVVVP